MATKSFIGIKKVWYAPPIDSVTLASAGLTAEEVIAKIAGEGTKEIKNIHQDTWGYEESDPEFEDYNNETAGGSIYFRDVIKQGVPTISFTLGEYEYSDKAALQGGTATSTSWERPNTAATIERCIIAQAKTGEVIVMPRASIIGKGNFVEKNIGLGVTAVPLETGVAGLASEKWFRGIVIP
jgi:hypothetical protein